MASSLNKAQIIGNLTGPVELRETNTGQKVVSFSVATNRTWKNANGDKEEDTEFHNIIAWGKLAEICNQYLSKGTKVFVEGRLKTRAWEKDGVKRYKTEIVCENMVILSPKKKLDEIDPSLDPIIYKDYENT